MNEEFRTLKDKQCLLERSNQKLQFDLDAALIKISEMNTESEKYNTYLRACEEQLNLSEKKRDELKQDAQETIKLFVSSYYFFGLLDFLCLNIKLFYFKVGKVKLKNWKKI